VTGTGLRAVYRVTRHSPLVTRRAFTLVEVMVVSAMLALIVLALMAVFNSTQTAFRAGITQTGVLESGRAVTDLIKSDLETMTPSFGTNNNYVLANFCAEVMNSFNQPLVGSSAARTNVMEDVFFLTRENQTWKGVGYFVRTNLSFSGTGIAGTLYRFETNNSVAQFEANPGGPFAVFTDARNGANPANGVSRLMDGVMSFKIRAFDANGFWITNNYPNFNITVATNLNGSTLMNANEVAFYCFYSNALPASVEVELGILEDRTLQRAESLPNVAPIYAQTAYLSNHVGQVHLFRQRAWIRNVAPSAYK
jgi:prepilin-type N-terminal cleavage/methylation domain-containing protein